MFSKIISVADIYDALTSNRAYRSKHFPFKIFQKVLNLVYSNKLDMDLVSIFIKNISSYYVGSKIKMKDGLEGEMIFIPSKNIRYPVLKFEDKIVDTLTQAEYRDFELV